MYYSHATHTLSAGSDGPSFSSSGVIGVSVGSIEVFFDFGNCVVEIFADVGFLCEQVVFIRVIRVTVIENVAVFCRIYGNMFFLHGSSISRVRE